MSLTVNFPTKFYWTTNSDMTL